MEIFDHIHHEHCPLYDVKDDAGVNDVFLFSNLLEFANPSFRETIEDIPFFYITAKNYISMMQNQLMNEKLNNPKLKETITMNTPKRMK